MLSETLELDSRLLSMSNPVGYGNCDDEQCTELLQPRMVDEVESAALTLAVAARYASASIMQSAVQRRYAGQVLHMEQR